MDFAPLQRGVCVVLAAMAVGCGAQQADLTLKVVDGRNGQGLAGATVSVNQVDQATNAQGLAHYALRADSYDVNVSAGGYLPLSTTIVLAGGAPVARTLSLYPRPDASPGAGSPAPGSSLPPIPAPSADPGVAVFGRVTDASGNRVASAMVMVAGAQYGLPIASAVTNAQGEYRLAHVPRGKALQIVAAADGDDGSKRGFTPTSDWRIDFTGQFALKPHQDATDHAQVATIQGTLQDTYGATLDGVLVHVESSNVRYPFDRFVIGRKGRYQLAVPTNLPLRFTAAKPGYRPTTFTDSVPANVGMGDAPSENFTGPRALDLAPVQEPGSMGALNAPAKDPSPSPAQ